MEAKRWPTEIRLSKDKRTLRVSFDNLSDQPAVFAFRGEMVAWGVSAPLTPAPEPASVLLMLAGLGAVAVVSRRRRQS